MAIIRTVSGDIAPGTLGRTNYHEHLLMRSPLLRGDELVDVEASAAEAADLRAGGIDALAELTPIGCGRQPSGVAEIARRSGLQIVLATGLHRAAHYPPEHWVHRTDGEVMAELFVRDLITGCDDHDYSGPLPAATAVRAGVIKVGTGYWSIAPLERRILAAAADAHRRTGAPIVCHLEQGTAGEEVLEVFRDHGVAVDRVALAHLDRNPDPELHLALVAAGAYLGYDGAGRAKYWPDGALLDCLAAVVEGGGADRVLLGGDVARRSSFRAHGGLPGMAYLPRVFVPRVRARLGDDAVHRMLVANPARLFAFEPIA